MRVLTVTASYDDDGRLVVDPGFVTDGEPTPDAERGEPALDVEVLDRLGQTLHTAHVPWTPLCAPPTEGAPGGSPIMAVGLVRYDRSAAGLRLSDRGKVLLERSVSRTRLTVEVEWPPPVEPGDDRHRLIPWRGPPETLAVPAYSADGGASWLPLGLPSPESPLEVDFTNVPGSKDARLRLVVTDGLRTVTVDSDPWTLAPTGWVGAILSPADSATVPADRSFVLAGQAVDVETRARSEEGLSWHAEGLGLLGTGSQIEVQLPTGTHQVELRLDDRALASITVTAA